MRDKKKIPAAEPVFSLAATDLLQVEQPTPHIARFLPSLRFPLLISPNHMRSKFCLPIAARGLGMGT